MAFATADDIAIRLGRDLTVTEIALAEQVIDTVTGLILDTAGTDAEPDPVPAYYKALCIEKVMVVGTNPNGLAQESETLGAHTYARTFQRSNDIGVFLTDREKREIRRIAREGSFLASTLTTPYSGTTADEQPELLL